MGSMDRRVVNRVYFVGAGFSKALGYPLGSEILPDLTIYLQRLGRSQKRSVKKSNVAARNTLIALSQFLAAYFNVHCDLLRADRRTIKAAFNGVGLTSFFNLIQTLTDSALNLSPPGLNKNSSMSLSELYDCLRAAIRSRFVEIYNRRPGISRDIASLYNGFDATREVVVSFNWDCEFEGSLWHRLKGKHSDTCYTLDDWQQSHRSCPLILKPHGSVTWYPITSGIFSGIDPIAWKDRRLPINERRLVGYFYEEHLPEDREDHEVGKLEIPPAIAPPTYLKRFDLPEQRLIWADIISVCRSAREFVFLGYRMPDDDFLTAAALRSAIQRKRTRCLVVNRSWENVYSSFESVYGAKKLVESRHFLRWTFGNADPTLYKQINLRISRANV